ncbi:hypothetical protein [Weissella kandleri]|uniref:hypothetical protein n=1 Tax=Weissella kandleri TaxID=1616 RepID=UPI0012EE2648|nr:hypothetical protein [Weissella kandleri]
MNVKKGKIGDLSRLKLKKFMHLKVKNLDLLLTIQLLTSNVILGVTFVLTGGLNSNFDGLSSLRI